MHDEKGHDLILTQPLALLQFLGVFMFYGIIGAPIEDSIIHT